MTEPLVFLICSPAGASEEEGLFLRLLIDAIMVDRRILVIAPEEIDRAIFPPTLAGDDLLLGSQAALSFGLVDHRIVEAAREIGARQAILVGRGCESLARALPGAGIAVARFSAALARADPFAPPAPASDTPPIPRSEARARIGADADGRIWLIFAEAGAHAALEAIDAVAAGPAPTAPLLILAGEWCDADRLRQRALLKNIAATVRFCGPVPADLRPSLVAAADALIVGAAAGRYRGFDAALAAALGTTVYSDPATIVPLPGPEQPAPAEALPAWGRWIAQRLREGMPRPATTGTRPDRVAVFMPTFNCRPWLAAAIESVESQTHPHRHLIVWDDGGGDVDDALLQRFPEVTFVRGADRTGPYAIANALLSATNSDFIAFHDADDESAPERLSEQLDGIARFGFDGVGSNSRVIDLDRNLIGVEVRPVDASVAMRRNRIDQLLHPTSLFARKALTSLGGFDDGTLFGADTELHFRAALTLDLGNLPTFLYLRRERPDALTRGRATGFGSEARQVYSDDVRAAFNAILDDGAAPPMPAFTLTGSPIGVPRTDMIALLRPGRGADAWLCDRLAGMVRA